MTIKVDQEKCIGCGVCESLCPACFKIGDDNKAQVIKDEAEGCGCEINDVMGACPEGAISVA